MRSSRKSNGSHSTLPAPTVTSKCLQNATASRTCCATPMTRYDRINAKICVDTEAQIMPGLISLRTLITDKKIVLRLNSDANALAESKKSYYMREIV